MGLSSSTPTRLGWTRALDWWQWKLPPLLAVAYLHILVLDVQPRVAISALAALALSAIALAAYAHVINDTFDVESDRLAGVPNRAATMGPSRRVAIIGGLAVVGALPWTIVDPGQLGLVMLAVIYAVPWVYSAPPLRLKGRGWPGVLADAVMAHVGPSLFASALIFHRAESESGVASALTVFVAMWALGLGIRGIVIHQLLGRDADSRSEVQTFVVRVGAERARRLARFAFPCEVAGLVGITAILGARQPLVAAVAVCGAIVVGVYHGAFRRPIDPAPVDGSRPPTLVLQYTTWPPLLLAVSLAVLSPAFWFVAATHALLFGRLTLRRLRIGVCQIGAALRVAATVPRRV